MADDTGNGKGLDLGEIPCPRCGNPREIGAYCAATEECRQAATRAIANELHFIRTGTWLVAAGVSGANEKGTT